MTIEVYDAGKFLKTFQAKHLDVSRAQLRLYGITGKNGLAIYEAYYIGDINFELTGDVLNVNFYDGGHHIQILAYGW